LKNTPAALRNHMAQGSTTLAVLNKITRRDGYVMAITLDHDRPLVYQGVVYEPKFGAMPSTIETTGALNVDNVDIKGALLALGVNEADISAGLWDGAKFIAYRVNWRNLSMGAEILKSGTFGEISVGRGTFTQEVRGITQKLQQVLGEVVSPSCKADLFDAKCGLTPLEGFSKFENVFLLNEFPVTRRTFGANISQADGWFDGGKVVWEDGANAGLSMEIKSQVGQQIELQEPMPYEITHDDHCTIYAGCLKRFTEDCLGKFANHVRYAGFPSVPGNDQMFKGPE
jgi:uncharacterized phage protein (TIGR02218 family)